MTFDVMKLGYLRTTCNLTVLIISYKQDLILPTEIAS